MTDEERQKQLVKDLREEASCWSVPQASVILCEKAADEIERLASLVEDYKITFGDIHEVVMGYHHP